MIHDAPVAREPHPSPGLADLFARIDARIAALEPELITLRRHLHRFPELSWREYETQRTVRDWLASHGVRTRDCAGTGLVADLGPPGPRILYRSDLDALPIVDRKDPIRVPWASANPGVCHACGHDVHTTIGAGLAALFAAIGADLPLRFVFQPAEEVVPSGAERMVREGVLDDVRAAFALHVDPLRDVHTVGLKSGPLTAATDSFTVEITGRSGHSARPHLASDALLTAAEVVRALYGIIPLRIDPLEPAVLNVGQLKAGEAKNVIAGEAVLAGVTRCTNPDVRVLLTDAIRTTAERVAAVHDCTAQTTIEQGAPPVRNDPTLLALVETSAREVLGAEGVVRLDRPSTGAEDFGFFSDQIPTFMMRLGVHTPGTETHHLHTPRFDIDEVAILHGVRIMARALVRASLPPRPEGDA
jgi:amidohydrolase